MSKRNKRRAKGRPRGPVTASPQAAATPQPTAGPQPGGAQPVAQPATPRPAAPVPAYAAGVTAPRRAAVQAAAVSIDIDQRVPHFTGDLRRIGLTAAVMLAIIIAASFLVH